MTLDVDSRTTIDGNPASIVYKDDFANQTNHGSFLFSSVGKDNNLYLQYSVLTRFSTYCTKTTKKGRFSRGSKPRKSVFSFLAALFGKIKEKEDISKDTTTKPQEVEIDDTANIDKTKQKFGGAQPSLADTVCNRIADGRGFGLTSIIIAIVALGAIMVPVTKWYMGMASETNDIQTKMTMYTIIQDKWDEIHAETFDDLASTLASKPSPWEEYIGEGNRYKIVTTIGNEGKYKNAVCTAGTAGATDRKCRKVAIQVTDTQTGMMQAVDLAKIDSEYFNSRMKALETKAASLETKVATAQSTADAAKSAAATAQSTANTAKTNAATAQSTANTAKTNAATAQSTANTANANANSALSKFGSYYTAAQVDSKVSSSTITATKEVGDCSSGDSGCSYIYWHICGVNGNKCINVRYAGD